MSRSYCTPELDEVMMTAATALGLHRANGGARGDEMRPHVQPPGHIHLLGRDLLQITFDLIPGMGMQNIKRPVSCDR